MTIVQKHVKIDILFFAIPIFTSLGLGIKYKNNYFKGEKNMYKKNTEVYLPNKDVMDFLRSPKIDTDRRLYKLWGCLGDKIIVDLTTVLEQSGNVAKDITQMFSTSDWAYELMVELLKFNPYATSIQIFPRYLHHSTPLQFSYNLFSSCTNEPVLFIKPECNFIGAIIQNPQNENIIDFYFWKLKRHDYSEAANWIDEQFKKNFSHNISVDTANCADKKEEILSKITEMFSTDPIAHKLKAEILRYNPKLHSINIQLCYTSRFKGKQYINDIWSVLAKHKIEKPTLLVENGSKYAVVMVKKSYEDPVINLYMWDLENTI